MRRLQSFEFCDQSWFPPRLRELVLDLLQIQTAQLYRPIAPLLQGMLYKLQPSKIIDIGSWKGGPWASLKEVIPNETELQFTDLYHSHKRVDARDVPSDYQGIRTLFSVFHHFDDSDAQLVLANAVSHAEGIAVFEFTQRRISRILGMLFSPIVVMIDSTRLRPCTALRVVFTYLIPIVPLVYWWDGTISHLRTRTPDELMQLVDNEGLSHWHWSAGMTDQNGSVQITWLIGYPKSVLP